jgi:hypothetical protein
MLLIQLNRPSHTHYTLNLSISMWLVKSKLTLYAALISTDMIFTVSYIHTPKKHNFHVKQGQKVLHLLVLNRST